MVRRPHSLGVKDLIKEVVKIIRRHLGEEYKIFLYGSWAKSRAQPSSDIDIGILGDKKIDDFIFLRIKEEIASLPTLRQIEIVDLNNVDEKFKKEVLKYAKLLCPVIQL